MTESGAGQSKFVYLLNAMENAAQSDDPFIAGYRDKLAAVLKYVADLETGAAFEAGRGQWISVDNPPAQNGEYLIVEAGDLESSTADYRDGEWWTVRSYGQDCEERQLYSVIWWRDMPAVPATHVRPAPPDSGDAPETSTIDDLHKQVESLKSELCVAVLTAENSRMEIEILREEVAKLKPLEAFTDALRNRPDSGDKKEAERG